MVLTAAFFLAAFLFSRFTLFNLKHLGHYLVLAMVLGVDEPWSWLVSEAGLAVTGIALGSGFAYLMFFYTIKTSGPVFAS